jgi:hypothetical protein
MKQNKWGQIQINKVYLLFAIGLASPYPSLIFFLIRASTSSKNRLDKKSHSLLYHHHQRRSLAGCYPVE